LLSRAGDLVLARDRVRFSGLLTVAILNAAAQVSFDWLALWDYRSLPQWDLATIVQLLIFPIIIFFICVVAVPATPDEGHVDMEAFYWKNRRLYYGLFALLLLVFMAESWILLNTSNPALALQQSLSNLPFLAAALLAIFVSARWAQWVAGVSILVGSVAWSIVFTSVLH